MRATCLVSGMPSLILAGMKSLSATAARAFNPVLIVLRRRVTCDLRNNFRISNLSEPEKTPAMKRPGKPGMSPAT